MILTDSSSDDQGAILPRSQIRMPQDNNLDRPMRTFLLEDDPTNAFLVECYLEELDLPPPVVVPTLEAASEHRWAILRSEYDLIMCDVMLPDGNSLRFVRELVTAGVPHVSLYTARGITTEIEALGRIGLAHVFQKPLKFGSFRDEVNRIRRGGTHG